MLGLFKGSGAGRSRGTLLSMVSGDQPGRVLVVRLGSAPGAGAGGAGVESTEYAPADAFFASLSGEARPAGRLAPLADLGGSAMTLALARAGAEPGRDDDTRGLALAVGPATRRGLPSSGRVHVGGRSPLTGAYTEGAVGGDLAWALASFASGLLVTGPARPPGAPPALLAIDARDADEGGGRAPRVELVPLTDLGPAGLDPGRGILDLAPALDGYLPAGAACPRALLLAGPAARRGLPFATLMAWTAGAPPLVTGRGGLGLVLAELGLVGVLVVTGWAVYLKRRYKRTITALRQSGRRQTPAVALGVGVAANLAVLGLFESVLFSPTGWFYLGFVWACARIHSGGLDR